MDNKLKEKYFKQCEKMLHKFAFSYWKISGIEKDELFSEACLAFLHACENYPLTQKDELHLESLDSFQQGLSEESGLRAFPFR